MEDKHYQEAKKRVKKIKDFYSHFVSWVILSIFFVVINLWTSPGYFWAIFPIAGWGIGIAFHAIDTFGLPGFGKDWEERRFQKELDRLAEREAAMKWREYEKQKYLDSGEALPEDDKMTLKELRKEWNDSDFV